MTLSEQAQSLADQIAQIEDLQRHVDIKSIERERIANEFGVGLDCHLEFIKTHLTLASSWAARVKRKLERGIP